MVKVMGTDSRTVRDEFLELLCSDPDLVQAEFDAIVAAEWPEAGPRPPSLPPGRRAAGWPADGAPEAQGRTAAALRRSRRPGVASWARQRSPP